jgi:hypothetical protein
MTPEAFTTAGSSRRGFGPAIDTSQRNGIMLTEDRSWHSARHCGHDTSPYLQT